MPIIRVEMFEGRTVEQKRALVAELTDAFCNAAGGNPTSVQVLLTEVKKEDWGMGKELALDKYPD